MPQIQGYNSETSIRGEWYAFKIVMEGKQYPMKLETKKQDVINAGLAAGTQMAVWTYNESEGGPNPHRPGTNYINRYLESVEVGGQLQVVHQQAPVVQQGAAPVVQHSAAPVVQQGAPGRGSPEERMSIERQTIVKATMHLYPIGAIGDDPAFFALLGRLDAFVAGTMIPRGQPGYSQQQGQAPVVQHDDPGPDPTQPLPDDDIPF